MPPSALPRIEIFDHVEWPELPLERIREQAISAVPLCLDSAGREPSVLGTLGEIEVSLVSDEAIAAVHEEFLDDATPTDVITFQHGEILVSVDTARREGQRHGNSPGEETLLYIIHGLLHLNGHTDLLEPDRTAMHREQERILKAIVGNGPGS